MEEAGSNGSERSDGDRQLLVVQDIAAVLFPATECVLGRDDDLVLLVESLPAKLTARSTASRPSPQAPWGTRWGTAVVAAEHGGAPHPIHCLPLRPSSPSAALPAAVLARRPSAAALALRCFAHCCTHPPPLLRRACIFFVSGWLQEAGYELLLWARKELENLEVVTADDGGSGDGNTVTVHGDKAPVDGKGEAATPAKRADVSGGQECGVVRVEDVQRVETPAAEITNAMKDTEIVKNKDQERGGSEREEEETVAMAGTGSREEASLRYSMEIGEPPYRRERRDGGCACTNSWPRRVRKAGDAAGRWAAAADGVASSVTAGGRGRRRAMEEKGRE
nr:uncharacterized protein LOC112938755 [Oryza sativa Japonica Group]